MTPSVMTPRERGAAAESAAALYLEARGVLILARNVRCRAGELDLVGLEGAVLVIVEVRLRRGTVFGGAAASVTSAKRRRLIRAARFLCQRNADWRARRLRFDVIAIQDGVRAGPDILWIRDAFRVT